MELFQHKSEIRKKILEKRDLIEHDLRTAYDHVIYERLINSMFYKNASSIFAFVNFRSEVDTMKIIDTALSDGKNICVPKIKSKEKGMEVFNINSLNDLKAGYFGILEPVEECHQAPIDEIDLILMPGAAFDRKGGRIGYGGGFYDRFLAKIQRKVDKIALAYDLQVLEEVPTNELDVRVDGIITNREIIFI